MSRTEMTVMVPVHQMVGNLLAGATGWGGGASVRPAEGGGYEVLHVEEDGSDYVYRTDSAYRAVWHYLERVSGTVRVTWEWPT